MKHQILALAFLATSVMAATAADEVMTVTLTDGTAQTFNVADVKEITFGQPSITDGYTGIYSGTLIMNVGGMYNYPAEIECTVTAQDDKLTVALPEYTLKNTVMGDITLSAVTLEGLEYDADKGGFFLNYGGKGLQQHMLAVQNGNTTFNKDYPLLDTSTILVVKTDDGISFTNPFKLGAMPLPMTASFTGTLK